MEERLLFLLIGSYRTVVPFIQALRWGANPLEPGRRLVFPKSGRARSESREDCVRAMSTLLGWDKRDF